MANDSLSTSFSARRRWGIFFSVIISMVAVTALVVMVNYLGARYYARLTLSAQARAGISPQALGLLKSITNDVKVVVYYDHNDDLYDSIRALLNEYHLRNPKISVKLVDYLVDTGTATAIKEKYKDYMGATGANKNLVIFDCNGRNWIIPGERLGRYGYSQVADGDEKKEKGQRHYAKNLDYFLGEEYFTSALLAVTSPKPMVAYFLEGQGEHQSDSTKDEGYDKFKTLMGLNYIKSGVITNLLGTNVIPADCNLLVIAGARKRFAIELEKIKDYLAQGGRLFVLFDLYYKSDTGLEPILADWGVKVYEGANVIRDTSHSSDPSGDATDLIVSDFNPDHPLVNPLLGSALELILPRPIGTNTNKGGPDAPKVAELAFAEETAKIGRSALPAGRRIPLMVAVEKAGAKAGFPERGSTRIVVVGDALFLDNQLIETADNRAFAGYAVNWLLERRQLLEGVGPRRVVEYKLLMTRAQMNSIRWIFLAGMPGVFLALGGVVWLRRRH